MIAEYSDSIDEPAGRPHISVIIPHYNDLVRLNRCLAAITDQADATVEIIVADNGSPQGEQELTRVIAGRARLIIASQRGAGPARNAGVACSKASRLAFTDADCVPDPHWLVAGTAALDHYDLVGGAMTVTTDPSSDTNSAAAFERVFAFNNAAYIRDKGFSVTANLFTKRTTFDAVGGFRVGVSEDLDWCRRATALGYTLGYAAAASVNHPARADWPELRAKWLRIHAETYALLSLSPPLLTRLRWLARAWLLPLSIIVHLPRIWRSEALSNNAERWAATRGLVRLRLWRLVDAHRLAFGLRR